jgi:hypothetical protein
MAFVTCRSIGTPISASVTGPPPSIPFFAVSTAGVMLLYGVSAGLPPDGVREGRGRSNLIWRGCRACAKHHRAEMRPDPIHRPGRDAASGRGYHPARKPSNASPFAPDSGHQPDFRDCLLLRDELPFPPSGALWSCASFVFKHRGRGFPCRALLGPQANSIREIRRGRQARHRRHELDGHREVGIGRASVYRILGAEPEHAIKMTNRFKKWPKGKLA